VSELKRSAENMKSLGLAIFLSLLLPALARASLETQIRSDLEGMIRMAFGQQELNADMLKRTLDEGVAEIRSQEPWLLLDPDPKFPLTTKQFKSTFEQFMKLPAKSRKRDFLTYYGLKKEKSGLNSEQTLLFYRLMQYQLALKTE
jgi:hypothetical protein